MCSRLAAPLFGALISCCALAQSPANNLNVSQPSHANKPAAAPGELVRRLAAASAARDSGDAAATSQANGLLIATALRELASLRSMESAYPQAIELYRSSLKFEDVTRTRIALAIVESRAGHYDEAIKLTDEVRASDPNDLRADRMLASFFMQKGDFAQAIEPFNRVAKADPNVENLYALANCLLQTRKPDDKLRAKTVFEQMKNSAGDSGSLHVLFGRAYRDAEDLPTAVREFQRAIAIDPHTPHAHYFLGLAELALNEWKPIPDAELEMKKEIEYYPHDYLANYMVGFLASGERRYGEAQTYLKEAASIDPTAPEPFLYMGLDAYAQGDMSQAEQMLRKAVDLTGKDEARSNYQIRRAYVDLGRILANSGRKEESDSFLAKARDLQNKTMEQSQQNIASIALAGGAASAAAVVPFNRQQENESAPAPQASIDGMSSAKGQTDEDEKLLRATLGLAFNDLATSEAIRGRFADAFGHYQQAERWDSSLVGLQKNLGVSAFRAGEYADAVAALLQALHQQPESAALRAMLGISYFNLDQYSKAAETFAPLGQKGMHDGEIGYAWAASLARTGDMKRASEVLTAFSSEPRSNDVNLLIGQLWTVIGDYARATAIFQQALQSDPYLHKAHFYSGLAYIHWQHWPEAEREFRAELDLVPRDPDAQYHLGFVYAQQTKMDEAVAIFRQVVASYPNYPNAQYQLGKILLDRGQVTDAIGYLEDAVQLSPQADYIHYQLQSAYRKGNRLSEANRELELYNQLKMKSRERAAEAATQDRK
jgi:tetratricopeptide (TPR) repeat protein